MKTYATLTKELDFNIRSVKKDGDIYLCQNDVYSYLGIKYPYSDEIKDILKSIKDSTIKEKVIYGEKEYTYAFIKMEKLIQLLKDLKEYNDENVSKYAKILLKTLKNSD